MVSIRGMGTNARAYSCEWVGAFSEKVALYCGRMTVNSPFGIWRDHIEMTVPGSCQMRRISVSKMNVRWAAADSK